MGPCSRILFHGRNMGYTDFLSSTKFNHIYTKSSNLGQNRKFHGYPSGVLGSDWGFTEVKNSNLGPSSVQESRFLVGLISRGLGSIRCNSTSVETRVNENNFERIYVQGALNVKPLVDIIDKDENMIGRDEESRVAFEVEEKNDDGVSVNFDEGEVVVSSGRVESEAEKEAWKLLRGAVVSYCGSPVGTLAANDPGEKLPLNYDQVFIRDFVPSALAFLLKGEGEIVRNFLLHTLQLQVIMIILIDIFTHLLFLWVHNVCVCPLVLTHTLICAFYLGPY